MGASAWWLSRPARPSTGDTVATAGGLSQGSLLEALVVLAVIGRTLAAFAISERSRRQALQALRSANEALRAQSEIARSIVELQTEWITRYDVDLRLTFVNGSFASLEGAVRKISSDARWPT